MSQSREEKDFCSRLLDMMKEHVAAGHMKCQSNRYGRSKVEKQMNSYRMPEGGKMGTVSGPELGFTVLSSLFGCPIFSVEPAQIHYDFEGTRLVGKKKKVVTKVTADFQHDTFSAFNVTKLTAVGMTADGATPLTERGWDDL